jgi:aminotransferase
MITVFGSEVGREELEEIESSLNNQWMGIGPKTRQFEEEFAKRLKLPSFTLLDSGSNALLMAVKILDLPPGSEIILPSFTWISCAHAIVLAGHKPVFCDVDIDTHNVTIETIESQITKKSKAIMVVHYAGKPVRIEELKDFNLKIIEDAAHAPDSKIGNVYCGNMGDVGIYSFDAIKNLAMPEGGGITVKDQERMKKTKLLRYCGIGKSGFEAVRSKSERWWEYQIMEFYPKLLPNDICASIGLAQLKKLDKRQAYRKEIWEIYQKEFEEIDWIIRPQNPAPDEQHSYFTYCLRIIGKNRDEFAKYLYQNDIYTTLRYHPLHLNPIYNSNAELPNSERLNEEALNIPLHPRLSKKEIEYIIDKIKSY